MHAGTAGSGPRPVAQQARQAESELQGRWTLSQGRACGQGGTCQEVVPGAGPCWEISSAGSPGEASNPQHRARPSQGPFCRRWDLDLVWPGDGNSNLRSVLWPFSGGGGVLGGSSPAWVRSWPWAVQAGGPGGHARCAVPEPPVGMPVEAQIHRPQGSRLSPVWKRHV